MSQMIPNDWLVLAEHTHLETPRLYLRPVSLNDASAMYHYASDPEVTAFVFEPHDSLDNTRRDIAQFFLKEPLGKYGIEKKDTRQFIGTIDIRIDRVNRKAELGYALAKEEWGQGIVPEAATRLLALAFEELALEMVFAFHDVRNPQSGRVMEKIGMVKQGTIENHRLFRGCPVTDHYYVMTKTRYQKLIIEKG